MIWKTRRYTFDFQQGDDAKGVMMGILNTTPDSFSDGGQHHAVEMAVAVAEQMITDGARIIDIGGESTRPGARAVSAEEEIRRTVPVIQKLRQKSDVLISIDTSKSSVAASALEAGADIVNDVTGLTGDKLMAEVCAEAGCGVVVMHMQGNPRMMQENPHYKKGILEEVQKFFTERLESLTRAGIDPDCICFDPGIGFGKTLAHNITLLNSLNDFQTQQDRPLLLGVSRKSMIGALTGVESPSERDSATAVLTALALKQNILLYRVHHVSMNKQALQIAHVMTSG